MGLKELKSRSLSDYVFTQIYQTRWSDNDMYQHMNNSIYFFLYDSIVNNYLMQHAGLDPSTSNEIGLIVNAGSNYFRSVRFPDIVELGLRVNRIGSSSVAYEIGVFKQGEKSVVAVGTLVHVFVDRRSNRPIESGMNDRLKEALGKLLVNESPRL